MAQDKIKDKVFFASLKSTATEMFFAKKFRGSRIKINNGIRNINLFSPNDIPYSKLPSAPPGPKLIKPQ